MTRRTPNGEIMASRSWWPVSWAAEARTPIPEMNALLQRILPLRPLRDCGFTEEDFKKFPLSVEANQQRLMTNPTIPST